MDDFITRYPEAKDLFLGDELFVRRHWKDTIFNNWNDRKEGTWIILDKIIDMVPELEKDDFNKVFYKYIGKRFQKERKEILLKINYFTRLKDSFFLLKYKNIHRHMIMLI